MEHMRFRHGRLPDPLINMTHLPEIAKLTYMKLTGLLGFLLLLVACQKSPQVDSATAASNPKEELVTAQDTSQTSPILTFKINREQASKYNLSVTAIASKIQALLQDSDRKFTDEEVLDQPISFTDNKGKLISIPIRSLVDTVYYE